PLESVQPPRDRSSAPSQLLLDHIPDGPRHCEFEGGSWECIECQLEQPRRRQLPCKCLGDSSTIGVEAVVFAGKVPKGRFRGELRTEEALVHTVAGERVEEAAGVAD